MSLIDTIEKLIRTHGQPMTVADIVSEVNSKALYEQDKQLVQINQVLSLVNNSPSTFQIVNGYVLLVKEKHWKDIITSYWQINDYLRDLYNPEDIRYIVSVLFFYKRLIEISKKLDKEDYLIYNGDLEFIIKKINYEFATIHSNLPSSVNNSDDLFNIGKDFINLIERIGFNKQKELWEIVNRVYTKNLGVLEFGNIFDYLLSNDSISNYKYPVNKTPFALRELMVSILNPDSGKSIYDPVAGAGSLLIGLSYSQKDYKLFGSEINRRIAQIGNMNLLMHGINHSRIEIGTCFEQINKNIIYDYIIGDLPHNLIGYRSELEKLYNMYGLTPPSTGYNFGPIILLSLFKLSSNGKAVLTVSDGFLVKKGKDKEIRDLLIKEDFIESIISLPQGALRPYTEAKASLLVINKNKPPYLHKIIQFINAKVTEQNGKSLPLNNEIVLNAFLAKEPIAKDSQLINIADLLPDNNLSADAYDVQFLLGTSMLKEGNGKLLSELVEIKSGVSPDKQYISPNGDIPLVKVESLSKDILDLRLDEQRCDKVTLDNRYSRAVISHDCILLARIGDNLKPTIFTPSNSTPQILLHRNVFALIPKKTHRVNIEYLYYQLHSTFVQNQIDKRRLGAVMPYISIERIKETVIPYMQLEAQIEFVDSQKANLIAEERKRVEERIKALGYKQETKQAESDIIKTLTHQLRPTFSGLNSITNRIRRIAEREHLEGLKEYEKLEVNIDPIIAEHVAIPDNFTLSQLLEKLSKDTKHISDILTNVDNVMNYKLLYEDLKEVNLLEFLGLYKQQKDIEHHRGYEIIVRGNPVIVLLHESSFKELFDQLLINAEKHAFVDKYKNHLNRIQFVVKFDKQRSVASIEYSNNGAPYKLTQKDFITAFEKGNKSKGSGIGGNYINRIVEAHKGKLLVREDYKKGFLLIIELPTLNNVEL